jgi:GR25 family glycosyltransferase involved in LPS biosynthesis
MNLTEENNSKKKIILTKKYTISDFPILYINLERDNTRNIKMIHELLKRELKFKRIDAVHGLSLESHEYRKIICAKLGINTDKMTCDFWLNRSNFKTMCKYKNPVMAKVGCYLSHLIAIKHALEKNYERVLILEDDMKFLKNYNSEFNIPLDADIYYLGGTFYHQNKMEIGPAKNALINNSKFFKIDIKELKMNGTFGYIIPNKEKIKEIYTVLMSVFNEGKSKDKDINWRTGRVKLRAQAIDFMYINHYQKNGNCYVNNPVMISHDEEQGSNINDNRKKYKLKFFLCDEHKKKLEV